jgi:hypothetical protein
LVAAQPTCAALAFSTAARSSAAEASATCAAHGTVHRLHDVLALRPLVPATCLPPMKCPISSMLHSLDFSEPHCPACPAANATRANRNRCAQIAIAIMIAHDLLLCALASGRLGAADMNWDDVRIFLAVARAGQILGAAKATGAQPRDGLAAHRGAGGKPQRAKLFRRLTTGSPS